MSDSDAQKNYDDELYELIIACLKILPASHLIKVKKYLFLREPPPAIICCVDCPKIDIKGVRDE